ncbi:glucan endo-1,3-beta-glucosidase-like [Phalaenopsis equestris]|uniref:glucan endo-1,3-beta-glucosidase-like n=1 Tax=Phalaenopsis equestris TaxID=78828 RepID=UPI0009E5B664|nr:glucan endo-1,3-beta-glucosidase-like [Phalaenopsis equestris]
MSPLIFLNIELVLLVIFSASEFSFTVSGSVKSNGVCYGENGDNLPPPSEVIDLYKSNNIRSIRLYGPNQDALKALKNSNIPVILGVPVSDVPSLASNPSAAASWIQNNVLSFLPDVTFRYITVGNQQIYGNEAGNILPAMQNVQKALQSAGLQDRIKVSTAVGTDVLGSSYPPSHGTFAFKALPILQPIIDFLAANGAPLRVNVYPYDSYSSNPNDISIDYALFTSPGTVVTNGQLQYQNLFDAIVDAVYSALELSGKSNVAVVVSETGWPSEGGLAATAANAQTYVSNLMKHVVSGTPKRPGSIEAYIFEMFDEDIKQPQGTENHYGLFYPNKQPKYSLSS